jgi:nicotinamidase-related amidase
MCRDTFESNPDLAANLKSKGVKEVVIFGLQSDACVRATSYGAMDAGFDVTVLDGAHSTYDTEEKKANEIEQDINAELAEKGAKIIHWTAWSAE